MNVTIGLVEGRPSIDIELIGTFSDSSGKAYAPGRHQFTSEVTLTPDDAASSAFAIDDITIGIGFHWERKERQVFRGGAANHQTAKGVYRYQRCLARRLRYKCDFVGDERVMSVGTPQSARGHFAKLDVVSKIPVLTRGSSAAISRPERK